MYLISNRQYDEVVEFLSAYVACERDNGNLREYNRFRRARLLIKALKKRSPVSDKNHHSINNKNI